jgi:hypothetical protein
VCTLGGLPVGFVLTGTKADERQTLLGIFTADAEIELLRPARKNEDERPGAHLSTPLRQTIESINQTFTASSTWNATADTPRPA